MPAAAQLVSKCPAVRTAAHKSHLTTRPYARHVALGDFYDALVGAVDEFAEVYMGLEGRFDSLPSAKRAESMRRAWMARKAAQDE